MSGFVPHPTGLSFSGADVKVLAAIDPSWALGDAPVPFRLDDLQTLSISIYRDKSPVRALGYRNVRGHSRGGRTIAGSMIFTLIDNHPWQKLLGMYQYDYSQDVGFYDGHPFPDQIPPFNLSVFYQNEQGLAGGLSLTGVDLVTDGTVMSIEDLITENTYQWVARDCHVYQLNSKISKKRVSPYVGYGERNEELAKLNNPVAQSLVSQGVLDPNEALVFSELFDLSSASSTGTALEVPNLGLERKAAIDRITAAHEAEEASREIGNEEFSELWPRQGGVFNSWLNPNK